MTDGSRRETFAQISGHRALDLVNTVQWRLAPTRREEDLGDYDDVVRWARQTGTITDGAGDALRDLSARSVRAAAQEAARVRRLREALYAALFEGAAPEVVVEEYVDAAGRGRLVRSDTGWAWEFPVDLALARRAVAVEAFDLLTRGDLSHLAQCHDAECGWVFLDTSPRHNRRWCVSADCGNRNRARDFYRRARAGADN